MSSIFFGPIFYLLAWALGGIITGLLLKGSIPKFKGGQVFAVMIAWIIAGITAFIIIAFPVYMPGFSSFGGIYGLAAGIVGGWLTVRQIRKAQKKAKRS
ncbi:MAG: hypothetical protein MUO76_12655 [Anaerolineaceae bacterium]|jgi:hypothetical protein|nr:hypothetical protein [Anaerolineaceae bacterium]